jgi:hypothetical protein
LEETDDISNINSKLYQKENKVPDYTPQIFEDVGRAFCVGVLDLIGINPVSRVVTS